LRAKNGPLDQYTLLCLKSVAGTLDNLARFSDALPVWREVARGFSQVFGAGGRATLDAQYQWAMANVHTGKPGRGANALQRIAKIASKTLGAGDIFTLQVLVELSNVVGSNLSKPKKAHEVRACVWSPCLMMQCTQMITDFLPQLQTTFGAYHPLTLHASSLHDMFWTSAKERADLVAEHKATKQCSWCHKKGGKLLKCARYVHMLQASIRKTERSADVSCVSVRIPGVMLLSTATAIAKRRHGRHTKWCVDVEESWMRDCSSGRCSDRPQGAQACAYYSRQQTLRDNI
jgi:hypothetical protein